MQINCDFAESAGNLIYALIPPVTFLLYSGQECGEKEFYFIRHSGFYFGFLFGCIQMTIWFFYTGSWILPIAGFLVGWCTNWLALKVIFRPLYPTKFLCWTVQGIFLKRQKEVSEAFARVACVEVLHVKAVWDAIFTGPLYKNFFAMLRAHAIVFTEELVGAGGLKPFAVAALGADKYAVMKESIAHKIGEKLPSIIDQSYQYMTDALHMEETINDRMTKSVPRSSRVCYIQHFKKTKLS